MRSPRALLPTLLVALAALAAGCGAGEVPADEVPGAPRPLTVPADDNLGGATSGDDAADPTATPDTTADADAAATDDAGTTTDPATTAPAPEPVAPATDDGAAAAPAVPPAEEPAPATEPAPAPDTGGTSEFCEQNVGAC